MIFLIACLAILGPVLLGGLIAWLAARADTQVQGTRVALEQKDKGYNPALTFGHKIKAQAETGSQLQEARLLASKQAAAMPRGANMRIGRLGQENLQTAGETQALENDPMTAVRIAAHHGWDGARTGAVAAVAAPTAVAAPAGAVAAGGQVQLTPGKDYAQIEINESMSPEEIRKARIANAKAKSAAMKAAKAAGVPAGVPAAVPGAAPATAAPAPTPAGAATAVSIEPPQLIEISEGMPPDDVRKARIANSKATSAFNKALKAAGIEPKDVEIVDGKVVIPGGAAPAGGVEEEEAAPVAAAPTVAAVPAAAVAVPEPAYIEISEGMAPDDVRKARIQNSKLKSEYNKALKAAGIDPKSLS